MKESLGTIMASFTYIYDPYAMIKEIDIIMSFESAMLDVSDRWNKVVWANGIKTDLPKQRSKTLDYLTQPYVNPLVPNSKNRDMRRQTIVKTYKELFDVFRAWWEYAVDVYNYQTGNWKDSIIICSKLRSDLMRIALKENLISLTSSMYTIQMQGTPAPAQEFFSSDSNDGNNNDSSSPASSSGGGQ